MDYGFHSDPRFVELMEKARKLAIQFMEVHKTGNVEDILRVVEQQRQVIQDIYQVRQEYHGKP